MGQPVEQLKKEISDCYLDEFKKELWWIKSLALLPIETKVKRILTGDINLPEKFDEVQEFWWWKNIINFISPSTAEKIFNFMKEKRLEIEKRKTEAELLKLKNEILWISWDSESQDSEVTQQQWSEESHQNQNEGNQEQADQQEWWSDWANPTIEWAVASWVGFWATAAMRKLSESANYRHLSENIDAKKVRWTIESGIEALEKHKNTLWSRLSSRQQRTIDKHIGKLKDGIKDVNDDSIALLREWGELDNKIPRKLLEDAWLHQTQLLRLEKYADQLAWCRTVDEMKAILRSNNLPDVSDEVLKVLVEAKDAKEFNKMTKILRHWSRINRCLQTFAWAMLIDVACLWLDVWVYLETQKEAKLIEKVNELRANNKKNQANCQLWIGIWSVLVEWGIIIACTAAWTSVWWGVWALVWLAVWAVATWVSMGADSLYYDVEDFYLQNKEDFVREKKAKINQAILQWIYNKKVGNSSINESIHEYINWAWWFEVGLWCAMPVLGLWDAMVRRVSNENLKNQKEASFGDACWSMIFLDEIQNGKFSSYAPFLEYVQSWKSKKDYLAWLDRDKRDQFEGKWKEMEKQIKLRLTYLENSFKDSKIINALNSWKWMETLNNIITQSKVYAELVSKWKWDSASSYENNLWKYKQEFFSAYPAEKLKKIEELKTKNPLLFQELMITSSLTSLLWEVEEDANYTENVNLVHSYQEWIKLTQTDKEKFSLDIPDTHKNVNFIEKLIEADFDISKVQFSWISWERLIDIVWLNEERNWVMEVSDNPFQNVLYRLAKELFCYSWENTMEWIMWFYWEEDGAVHWIYYKDEWIINNDWAIDSSVEWDGHSWKVFQSQAEVNQYVDEFMKKNISGVSTIDTPTENIDEALQKEFETKFRTLLKEELSERTQQNQRKVKTEITNFVKSQSKNGEYLELPYYLLLRARKAWLWDLQRQFFRWQNGKLEVCLLPSELKENSLDAKISYITSARDKYTEEEQIYIDRVEKAHNDVENLRNLGGTSFFTDSFEDELDLPKEIEILISDKYKEWEKFKSDVLVYDAWSLATISIYERYKEFAEYFENLYRWFLLALTNYSVSNDIDTYALFSQAVSFWNQEYFDEKWNIIWDTTIEFLKRQWLISFYNSQIEKHKIGWKSIKELWSSESLEDRELAKRASKMILTTILEQSMLSKDSKRNITSIHIWGHWFDSDSNNWYEDDKWKTESLISKKLAWIKKMPLFDVEKIKSLQKKQEIKNLKKEEREVVVNTSKIQKLIEGTKDDIVWQWKRGNIEYNPEKSTIKSWNNEVKVEEKNWKYYLNWLNLAFSNVKELVWIANFRNWAKYKFPGREIEYDRDLFNSSFSFKYTLVVAESWPKSDTMLIARWDLENYCPMCKSDDVVKKLAVRLNTEVNKNK